VVCDGRQREFVIVACCGPFNVGKADVVATVSAPSGTATDSKTVNIAF
jgi:hypothetical protein